MPTPAAVSLRISADDVNVIKTLNSVRKSVASLSDVSARGSRISSVSFNKQIQATKQYLQEQEKARDAYVSFWERGLAAQERAEASELRSKRIARAKELNRILKTSTILSEDAARQLAADFEDVEGSLQKTISAYQKTAAAQQRLTAAAERSKIAERTKEFNRVLRDSRLISEDAARALAADFKDVEGSLAKATAAYQRAEREAEAFRKEQDRLGRSTKFFGANAARLSEIWSNVSNVVSGSLFVFRELQYTLGTVVRGIINTTARYETMRATLRVTERDIDSAAERLLDLNRVVTGIDIDTLLRGFTQFRVAGATIEQAETNLRSVALATSELGKSTDVTARVIEQLAQAFSSNIPAGDDLKTIFREIPQFSQAATTALGVQIQSWKDFANVIRETSNLDLRTAFNRSLAVLGTTAVGGDPNTYAVQIERFEENIEDLRRAIGESLVPAITRGIRSVNDFLRSGDNIDRIATGFRDLTTAIKPTAIAVAAYIAAQKLILPAVRTITPQLAGLGTAWRTLNAEVAAAGGTGGAFRRAATAIHLIRNPSKNASSSLLLLSNRYNNLKSAASGVVGSLKSFATTIGPQAAAIAAITIGIKLYTDAVNDNRKAQELLIQTSETNVKSIRSVLGALENVDSSQSSNAVIQKEAERLSASIAALSKAEAEAFDRNKGFSQLLVANRYAVRDQGLELRKQKENEEAILKSIDAFLAGRITKSQVLLKLEENLLSDLQKQQDYIESINKIAASARSPQDVALLGSSQTRQREIRSDLVEIRKQLENIKQATDIQLSVQIQPPTALDLSKARAAILDAEAALNAARESGNIKSIQNATRLLSEAYSAEAVLRRRHARATITDEDKLAAQLFDIMDSVVRKRLETIEASNTLIDKLRRDQLPPLINIEDYRKARESAEETFQSLDTLKNTFEGISSGTGRLFSNIGKNLSNFGKDIQGVADAAGQGIADLNTKLKRSQTLSYRLAVAAPLLFPELTKNIGTLTENYGKLNRTQKELLPALVAYRTEAIETFNAVEGVVDSAIAPFQRFAESFRNSDLNRIFASIRQQGGLDSASANIDFQKRVESQRAGLVALQDEVARSSNLYSSLANNALSSLGQITNATSDNITDTIKESVRQFIIGSGQIIAQATLEFNLRSRYEDILFAKRQAYNAAIAAGSSISAATAAAGSVGGSFISAGLLQSLGIGLGLAGLATAFTFLLKIGDNEANQIGYEIDKSKTNRRY